MAGTITVLPEARGLTVRSEPVIRIFLGKMAEGMREDAIFPRAPDFLESCRGVPHWDAPILYQGLYHADRSLS